MQLVIASQRGNETKRRRALSTAAHALLILVVTSASLGAQTSPEESANDLVHGKRLFEVQCARCHGIKGGGGTGANLARPVLRHAADDKGISAIIKDGIPGTAMSGNWFLTDREIRQVTRYVRSLGRIAPEALPGDPHEGKRVFAKNDCATCHIVRGQGGSVGPDLSDIGARRGPDMLRKAVIHPGNEVPLNDEGYAAYLFVVAATDDGRVVTGVRVNEDTFTIQLRDGKNRLHSLNKPDLAAFRKTGGSMMPSYQMNLSPADVDHLIAYLASLQGAER